MTDFVASEKKETDHTFNAAVHHNPELNALVMPIIEAFEGNVVEIKIRCYENTPVPAVHVKTVDLTKESAMGIYTKTEIYYGAPFE